MRALVTASLLTAALLAPGALAHAAPAAGEHRLEDYFPVGPMRRFVYSKTVRSRMRGEERTTLVRTAGGARDGRVRVTDSEGEFQDLTRTDAGPAMGGQSMTSQGFQQRYEPALQLFPAVARLDEEARFEAAVVHRTALGSTRGRVTRVVRLAGVEAVETPAGRFEGCLRFEVHQENRPDSAGAFVATTDETVWLAPGVGEVKSVGTTTLGAGPVPFLRAEVELVLERVEEPL